MKANNTPGDAYFSKKMSKISETFSKNKTQTRLVITLFYFIIYTKINQLGTTLFFHARF